MVLTFIWSWQVHISMHNRQNLTNYYWSEVLNMYLHHKWQYLSQDPSLYMNCMYIHSVIRVFHYFTTVKNSQMERKCMHLHLWLLKKIPFNLQWAYYTNFLYGLATTFNNFTEHIQSLSTFCLILCFLGEAFVSTLSHPNIFLYCQSCLFVSFFFLSHYLLVYLPFPTLSFILSSISYLTVWAYTIYVFFPCQCCLNRYPAKVENMASS